MMQVMCCDVCKKQIATRVYLPLSVCGMPDFCLCPDREITWLAYESDADRAMNMEEALGRALDVIRESLERNKRR